MICVERSGIYDAVVAYCKIVEYHDAVTLTLLSVCACVLCHGKTNPEMHALKIIPSLHGCTFHVLCCIENLLQVVPHFGLREHPPSFVQLHQCLDRTTNNEENERIGLRRR